MFIFRDVFDFNGLVRFYYWSQAKFQTASSDIKRNILNKSMMGGHSTAEALSANKRSTTMATGVPIALTSPHTPSSASMKIKYFTLFILFCSLRDIFFSLRPLFVFKYILMNAVIPEICICLPHIPIKWFKYDLSQCDMYKDLVVRVSESQFTGNQLYLYLHSDRDST